MRLRSHPDLAGYAVPRFNGMCLALGFAASRCACATARGSQKRRSPRKACGDLMLTCLANCDTPTESLTLTFPLYVRPRVVEMTSGAR